VCEVNNHNNQLAVIPLHSNKKLSYRLENRAIPVQHFVNPGHQVQAVSCTHKNHVTLSCDLWPRYSIGF